MSLKVWLPLNGNLNNQGLSNIKIINNGATIDTSGKIVVESIMMILVEEVFFMEILAYQIQVILV